MSPKNKYFSNANNLEKQRIILDFFFCAPISLDAACPIESNFNLESDYADLR